jgi:hypothetical protein
MLRARRRRAVGTGRSRVAQQTGPDGPAPGDDAGEHPEPGGQLALGEMGGGLVMDRALAPVMDVVVGDVPRELLGHGARAQDQEIVAGGQAAGHRVDEPAEMLHPMRLTGGLRMPAPAPLPDRRIVPDVPSGAMVGRDLRFESHETDLILLEPGNERLAGVDPDEALLATGVDGRSDRPVPVPDERGHQRAQAGPVSVASARSA